MSVPIIGGDRSAHRLTEWTIRVPTPLANLVSDALVEANRMRGLSLLPPVTLSEFVTGLFTRTLQAHVAQIKTAREAAAAAAVPPQEPDAHAG